MERFENRLKCKWLGLSLDSPFIMSSLTLVSNVSLSEHVKYLSYMCDYGAGAIVLPSINSQVKGDPKWNSTIADCTTLGTGLDSRSKMGFSVLGPTVPNIISINYGINLAQKVKERLKVPVVGSIVNLGESYKELIDISEELCRVNVDALELNFSCPNIRTKGNGIKIMADTIKRIKETCDIPVSLKIAPQYDFLSEINNFIGVIDGITLSNAYIGLIPPKINQHNYSPFSRRREWSPSGIYGPFEKYLTFYDLYRYKIATEKTPLNLACVGGIVSSDDAIQAILLGADVVELSSAILWRNGGVFSSFNASLLRYLEDCGLSSVHEIKGTALESIRQSADNLTAPPKRYMFVNASECKCEHCSCVNRLCLAFSKMKGKPAVINKELCSGCGMCIELCKRNAIKIIEEHNTK